VKCELVATGCAPRLWLDMSWLHSGLDDEFQDHVLASSDPDGEWRFWWPWIQPISPVNDMASAVDYICRSADLPGDGYSEADGEDGSLPEVL
jgi:hypothetical protein